MIAKAFAAITLSGAVLLAPLNQTRSETIAYSQALKATRILLDKSPYVILNNSADPAERIKLNFSGGGPRTVSVTFLCWLSGSPFNIPNNEAKLTIRIAAKRISDSQIYYFIPGGGAQFFPACTGDPSTLRMQGSATVVMTRDIPAGDYELSVRARMTFHDYPPTGHDIEGAISAPSITITN